MNASIKFDERHIKVKVYVATEGPPILGCVHQFDLNIMICPRSSQIVMTVCELSLGDVLDESASVFNEKIGLLKGYVHKIVLQPGTVPIQHKLRRVPLAAREEVKGMLKQMLDDGVIEPEECYAWISPVVITAKPDGTYRLCVDLHFLNKHVVADTFPLPNINELVLLLKGGGVSFPN